MANYLYNGIELPALPEWDKTMYPYAFIVIRENSDGSSYYSLYVIDIPGFGTRTGADGTEGKLYYESGVQYQNDGEQWTRLSNSAATWTVDDTFVWANFDIIDATDMSVFLAASEPVPVGGVEEEESGTGAGSEGGADTGGTDNEGGETTGGETDSEKPSVVIPISANTYIKKGGKLYKVNGGTGGDCLPEITEDDEGKVLTAKDGKAVWLKPLYLSQTEVVEREDFPLGLWHRSASKLGSFYDCENVTGEQSPAVSSRMPRRRWMNLSDGLQGMFCSKDALYMACDGEMMMALAENKVKVLGNITTEEKVFGALGKDVLILPDFDVYNTSTEKLTAKYIKLTLSNAIIQNNSTLYCTSYDFTSYFVAGDAIRLAATNSNNGYYTIRYVEKNYLHFDENSFVTESLPTTIYVLLDTPVFNGMCTANNRLWAYGIRTIYACAPGNVVRWYRYDGDEQSSYKATIPSNSIVTGCVGYSGYPVFFTANSMVHVEGDSPENFSLVETSLYGVKDGSAASLCVVGDKMLYLSDAGVVSCNGSTAVVISEALGKRLTDGIATSDGRRYYLSAVDDQGVRALYVYDTVSEAWYKEDSIIKYLAYLNGDIYAYCTNNVVYIIGEDTTEHGTLLGAVSSYVVFHPLQDSTLCKITPKYLDIAVECDTDCTLTLSLSYDGGEWEEFEQFQTEGSHVWSVLLDGRTCRSLGIRIDGVGSYKITSLIKAYSKASTEDDDGYSDVSAVEQETQNDETMTGDV